MSFRKEPSTPKEKKKEDTFTPKKHPYVTIDQPLKEILSFEEIHISKYCSSIVITGKYIIDFVGLPQLEYLTMLNLDSNPIKSFKGAPKLPSLRWLSIKNSPISRNEYFKLMCLVAFGTNIVMINGMRVPKRYKDQANSIEDELLPELQRGRLISNIKPIRLIDTNLSSLISPNRELMKASMRIGYNAPPDKEYTKALTRPDVFPLSIPSVAVICEEIVAREDDECYLPSNTISKFTKDLSYLRSVFNAQFEEVSNYDYDDNEQDEIDVNNDNNQYEEDTNDDNDQDEEDTNDNNDQDEVNTDDENEMNDSSSKIKALSSDDSDVQALSNNLVNSDSDSGGNYSQNSTDHVIIEETVEEVEENEQTDESGILNENGETDENENTENFEEESFKENDFSIGEENEEEEEN